MKRIGLILGLVGLAIVPLVAWAGTAHAQTFSRFVDKDVTINGTLYSSGKNVDINGIVDGDIFCAGQTVTIDATVHGDVICAGMDVTVSGQVDGDIRVAGQTVSVAAKTAKSVTIAASQFSLDADASVGRDLTVMGSTATIKGIVGRDVVATVGDLTLNGKIGRNAQQNGALTLRPEAAITGNLHYTSRAGAVIEQGASVAGTTEHVTPKRSEQQRSWADMVSTYLYVLAALLAISLVLVLLFPKWLHEASGIALQRPGRVLLTGFLGGIAIPFTAFLAAITFVGLPLAMFILLFWAVIMALSGPIAGYWLGRLILRNRVKNAIALMLLGSAILLTLYFIPYIGIILIFAAYWFGSGMLILFVHERAPKPAYKLES